MSTTIDNIKIYLNFIHPETLSGAIIIFILFMIGGFFLSIILKHAIRVLLERDKDQRIDRLSASFITRFTRVFLWLFIVMMYAHVIPELSRLGTALLAGVSIASVVLGLAAQSTLANLIAGISLVLYKPFRMGDRVQITTPTGVETGVVENVSLGYTVLQTFDNRRIVMSNSLISNQVMINLTSVSPRVMAIIPLSIGYGANIDRARAIALELAEAHPGVQEVVGCPLIALSASSVDFSLRTWCADAGVAATVRNDLLESIKKRFDQESIEIPYAYHNVIIRERIGNNVPGPAVSETDLSHKAD